MNKLFSVYELKARLAVVVILVTPVISTMYLQIAELRNIASTVVVAILFVAISYFLMIYIRYKGKNVHNKRDLVASLLYPDDDRINSIVKKRIYGRLIQLDSNLDILENERLFLENREEYKNACHSAINLIKEITRDKMIVLAENAEYGFVRNLKGVSKFGFVLASVMVLAHIFQFGLQFDSSLEKLNLVYITSLFISVSYILFWIYIICKVDILLDFCTENYGEALILSFDGIEN